MTTWADDLRAAVKSYQSKQIIPLPPEVQALVKKLLGDLLCEQAFIAAPKAKINCVLYPEYCAPRDFLTWSEHVWYKTDLHIRELSLLSFLKEQGFKATLEQEPSRLLVELELT